MEDDIQNIKEELGNQLHGQKEVNGEKVKAEFTRLENKMMTYKSTEWRDMRDEESEEEFNLNNSKTRDQITQEAKERKL